jgi:hypothetical protein
MPGLNLRRHHGQRAAARRLRVILQAIIVLGGWSWWILGLILLAVEVIAPGFFFLCSALRRS